MSRQSAISARPPARTAAPAVSGANGSANGTSTHNDDDRQPPPAQAHTPQQHSDSEADLMDDDRVRYISFLEVRLSTINNHSTGRDRQADRQAARPQSHLSLSDLMLAV